MTAPTLSGEPRPGIEVPDARGRTHLDRAGRDLDRNPRVVVRDVRLLTSNWYVTRVTTFDFQHADGRWSRQERETYDRGDGACVLLFNTAARTVLLTEQFRYPAYVNEHPDGMLLEVPAGLLDDEDPEVAIRRESQEETGYVVGEVHHLFDLYTSPGSVTERLHFFAAPYEHGSVHHGTRAGVHAEGEDIRVVELDVDHALGEIGHGIVDAKTVLLLQWAALEGPFSSASWSPAESPARRWPGARPRPRLTVPPVRRPVRPADVSPERSPNHPTPGGSMPHVEEALLAERMAQAQREAARARAVRAVRLRRRADVAARRTEVLAVQAERAEAAADR
ncbi:NUDIX domain-containing protein [Kineococcus radiotolerans]|uniref:NUDIX hydrolase n=1 Tax=Kineococcus radiotolerans (strain ATCC BAA-149 / DSM 14245 / SRS30216) TaxID=266940 RepID=A6WBI0_KINRD|nr:NUDIX domain-containing protein [Kineococcus radiotolerans]ABS04169.1 NUDIX hydrolase [Kineococcus radiotolerans SRS30216 = ATCC BAA-149]